MEVVRRLSESGHGNGKTLPAEDVYLQRYAWARAADAGAVSAFRTASRRVEATKRTLCT